MIKSIDMQNYKSIVDLKLELGRVNVIIGANGTGKINILEAISVVSAASLGRFEEEYLGRRIRWTEPEFMISELELDEEDENTNLDKFIRIVVNPSEGMSIPCLLYYNQENKEWVDFGSEIKIDNAIEFIKNIGNNKGNTFYEQMERIVEQNDNVTDFTNLVKELSSTNNSEGVNKIPVTVSRLNQALHRKKSLDSFITYAPEESYLRQFSIDSQIKPFGRKGEGLFKHLKELMTDEDTRITIINALNDGLSLLDWFKELKIPEDLFAQENRLDITDRFLKESAQVFDEKSTNEGFLYLLFYLVLFNSPKAPVFFAIDNIETSFNPKLTTEFVRHIIKLAQANNRQVIITTHSPFVLDGLDLSDDEQRLYVVRRNIDGHTKLN
ncbi:MAG: AAA family ATPase [Rikenellaceae bacterium]